MANIVITSTTNSIKADFGVYASSLQFSKGTWNKSVVSSIQKDSENIHINIQGEREWVVSHDGADSSLIVDTVDGVAPSDLDDLYTKLVALIS